MEVWKTIPGFPDYSASDHGRIRRDTGGNSTRAGRMLKPVSSGSSPKDGHIRGWQVGLRRDGRTIRRGVHRLVLETFVGQCPEGMEGCHNDGEPANNRLDNLRWDTHAGNCADTVRHGRSNRGDRSPTAKLTEADARLIRTAFKWFGPKLSRATFARSLGVSTATISNIKLGKTWGWVTI